MTLSLLAVVTDVVRDGRRVIGYGFRPLRPGRAHARAVHPRLLEADPATRIDEAGDNLDPHRCRARMFSCIPHGGHQMSLNIAAGLGLGGQRVLS